MSYSVPKNLLMNQLFSDHSVTSTRTQDTRLPLLPLCLSWAEHMTEMKGADEFCKVPIAGGKLTPTGGKHE